MNVGVSLCIWAACAVLSMTSSLCFAEIGIAFPYSGAHYYFIKRCFGSLIAFLRLWTSLFTGAGIVASQALLLVEYGIQPFYPNCSVPNLPKKCLALAVLWIVGILNSRGVRELSWLQTGSTVLKMGILGFISLSGVFMLVRIKRENAGRLENAFDAEFPVISQLTEAFFQGYFAFSGGESFTYVAGAHHMPITCSSRAHHVTIMCSSRAHHVPIKCPSRAHHVLITCPSRAHHVPIMCPSSAHHVLITCPSRAHHVLITCPSRAHHVPITCPSSAHHVLITCPSRAHHVLIMCSLRVHRSKGKLWTLLKAEANSQGLLG
ncbi:solute carrier family 7 (cationic amino acid transporter y+ system) member 13 [Cricetulus griseus]